MVGPLAENSPATLGVFAAAQRESRRFELGRSLLLVFSRHTIDYQAKKLTTMKQKKIDILSQTLNDDTAGSVKGSLDRRTFADAHSWPGA